MYATVDGLAISFAAALKPLKKLEHLYLGIYLSDLDVFHRHLVHCAIDILSSPAKPGTHSKPPFAPDECVICIARHATDVRARELLASALVARTLQSLKSIAWSSYFAEDEPGDDVMARSTNVWIHRKDGKIRVRRAPW
ncbi:hypothetical protein A0H81_05878 [Grifola frondosa]|uniref:Uncharacterized protein n=1 Tax=Grifola frondosa TaxID=5627 RepID=A0A1C7MB95_GRIFR|nr:hypothetical protein A0H81_05878 [Grifola frondosa]